METINQWNQSTDGNNQPSGRRSCDVVAALDADGGGAAGGPATQEEFDWARATAHTRAMGAKVAGLPAAFIVPGAGGSIVYSSIHTTTTFT